MCITNYMIVFAIGKQRIEFHSIDICKLIYDIILSN